MGISVPKRLCELKHLLSFVPFSKQKTKKRCICFVHACVLDILHFFSSHKLINLEDLGESYLSILSSFSRIFF